MGSIENGEKQPNVTVDKLPYEEINALLREDAGDYCLKLVLKGVWYRMIESGEKVEEYREITPYWCNRLLYYGSLGAEEFWEGVLKNTKDLKTLAEYGTREYDTVTFYHGYAKNRPQMTLEFKGIEIKEGKPEWGAEPGRLYFVIKLGKKLTL